jgi:hypothetical protein
MKVSWPHWAMRFTPHDTNEAGLHVRLLFMSQSQDVHFWRKEKTV